MNCRFCDNELQHEFADLANSPPSNSYLTKEQLNEPEIYFPLKVYVCEKCWLVQSEEYKKYTDIFNNNYAYFSSYSKSWLKHCQNYVNMITDRLSLKQNSSVIEIASNDGYLLQYFVKKEIPCIGIEPTANTAKVAESKGIPMIKEFFTAKLAGKLADDGQKADLIIANNVLAHTPLINDFIEGLKLALKSGGTITLEFPHLLNLIKYNQFDTIYHEHFSYLSLLILTRIFTKHQLAIYDVQELPTHGGSLRVYAKHKNNENIKTTSNVADVMNKEVEYGLNNITVYQEFMRKVDRATMDFLSFIVQQKTQGKKIAAYGAAAKGNALLNYCGIKADLIDFVVDASAYKQNKYLPGSHIPIVSEEFIKSQKPDYIIIFPWNIKDEITEQLSYVSNWNCKFVIAIPKLEVLG